MTAATSENVLILEDDALIALDAADQIEAGGYCVLPATRVSDALRLIRQEPVDLAILDYALGAETAIPVVRLLMERKTPFAVVSGSDPEMIRREGVPAGCIFSKPGDYLRIARRLQTAA